jgi:Xaa-Pro aminopeptidase
MKSVVAKNGAAPVIANKAFADRRKKFLKKLLPNSVAIFVSNPEQTRSNDTEFPYRQSSDIMYLSNFLEPQTVVILSNVEELSNFAMIVRAKDRTREIWTGRRFGPVGAKKEFGAEDAYPVEEFSSVIKTYLNKAENIYYKFGRNGDFDKLFNAEWLNFSKPLHNPELLVHEMRLVKSAEELALMQHAGAISAKAHCEAIKACKPGMKEYQIQAILEKVFLENGASGPAYTSIVAGGDNAVILHYIENRAELLDGELLLIDAACEYQGYASDITRTFPINGKFTDPQREIYEVVLAAQVAAIKAAKVGTTLFKVHEISSNVLRAGLIELGVLDKKLDSPESEAAQVEKAKKKGKESELVVLRDLFMHGTSHWLGLDVHDVGTNGTRSALAKTMPMEQGMVFTVEPGLYFDPSDKRLPKRYRGIGVRIEDDVLITKNGSQVLTAGVPKECDEIEALMAGTKSVRRK